MSGPHGKTLCIPTAFIGYHGEALDHKVPLLRSMEFVARQAQEALKLLGREEGVVTPQCGPEQEYFLIDAKYYKQRPDLMFANRTLQGARPPKGQELEDHYFGAIKERALHFMQDLELALFRLGIPRPTGRQEHARDALARRGHRAREEQALLDDVVGDTKDIAQIESPPRMEGRNMFMVVAPGKAGGRTWVLLVGRGPASASRSQTCARWDAAPELRTTITGTSSSSGRRVADSRSSNPPSRRAWKILADWAAPSCPERVIGLRPEVTLELRL